MNVSLIRMPKDKYYVTPEKIIGMFIWENDKWEIYAPLKIKEKIDQIGEIRVEFCIENKRGIHRIEEIKQRTDKDWLKGVHGILRLDFNPPLGVGDIENFSKEKVSQFKDIFVKRK